MIKARILEDHDGLSTISFNTLVSKNEFPVAPIRIDQELPGSLGYTYCFSLLDLTIFNFGKIRNDEDTYDNIISITHAMHHSGKYPDEWKGLLSNALGRQIHEKLKSQYPRRAWYAVPEEYCYLKQNVCRRKIPKECWALFND